MKILEDARKIKAIKVAQFAFMRETHIKLNHDLKSANIFMSKKIMHELNNGSGIPKKKAV